jgi:hypothetical protein
MAAASRPGWAGWAGPLALAAVALFLALLGGAINFQAGHQMGTDAASRLTFAAIAVGADVLALAMPAAACALWHQRERISALVAWAVWAGTLALCLFGTFTFSTVHLADRAASRQAVVATASDLATQRAARIEAAQLAVSTAAAARAAECTIRGERCRQRELDEQHAVGLLNAALALPVPPAPPIAEAAPDQSAAARLARSLGAPADSFANARIGLLTVLPNLGGLIFGFAVALRRRGGAVQVAKLAT